jgi:outer membrane protein OmpU
MKKILLATTVLAMTATVAAAEVAVSGNGRMGVTYNEGATNTLAFTSRVRVAFAMSGETDGGLAFGGSIRADNSAAGAAGTAGSVFISGAFGKLSMGDVSGAAEVAVGDLHGVGLTGLGDTNENVYLSNSAAARRSAATYEYSAGAVKFAVSADNPGSDVAGVLENVYALGVVYSADTFSVGLGYEASTIAGVAVDHVIVGATASFGDVEVKATYGSADKLDLAQYGVSGQYTSGAMGVTAFYRVEEDTLTNDTIKYVGIGASYDLGGGASVVGGIANAKATGLPSNTVADFGVSFSF